MQRNAVADRFLDTIMSVRVRWITAVVLTLALTVFELLPLFGVDLREVFGLSSFGGALALLDLDFVVCLFALAIPEWIGLVRGAVGKRVGTPIFLAVGFVLSLAYLIPAALIGTGDYPLFGIPFGIGTLSLIGATYCYESALEGSFRLVSVSGIKYAVDRRLTRTLEKENAALDGLIDEYQSKTARVFKTSFVSDFFERNRRPVEDTAKNLWILAVLGGASLCVGVVRFFLPDGGILPALAALVFTYLFSAPAALLLSHKLAYFACEKEAQAEDSTFIGAASIPDYAGVDVVTYDDTEIFGKDDVALKRVILYGDRDHLPRVLRQTSSLFASVGGPLDHLFASSLDHRTPPALSTVIEADGVSGIVEGVIVSAGSRAYMERHGVVVPADEEGQLFGGTRCMYAAEEGKISAQFHIRYSFSEEFTMLLPLFRDAGIFPLVYTCDPNITDRLLTSLAAQENAMRVIRKFSPAGDDDKTYDRLSVGIVTLGVKSNAVNMLFLAKKFVRFGKRVDFLSRVVPIAGLVISAVLAFAVPALVPSFVPALWQILVTGAFGLWVRRVFRRKPEDTETTSK